MKFYTTIEPVSEYGLNLYEQTTLAIITHFSQDGEGAWFGSLETLSKWLGGCTKKTALKALKNLEQNGFIKKEKEYKDNKWVCTYTIIGEFAERVYNLHSVPDDGCTNYTHVGVRDTLSMGVRNTPNNKDSIIYKNNNKELTLTLPFSSSEFVEVWNTLIRQPKWRNKTADALKQSLKTLQSWGEATAIQAMRNSIAGGWQGLFIPKDTMPKKTKEERAWEAYEKALAEYNNDNDNEQADEQ